MAKRQELILNTGKLSGLCGRLMCCLGYEYNESSPDEVSSPEEDAAIPEDVEMFEVVVDSGEPSEETAFTEPQPVGTMSEQPQKTKEQETKDDPGKPIRRRRKRRRRPHKK
jgi:hypothetical protein